MRLHDIKDMNDLRDMSSNDVVEMLDELRAIATRRGTELLQQGRVQARRAIGAPHPGTVGGVFLVGIALGTAVGAVVAALMTPMPGREARHRLAKRAEEMKDRIPEMHVGSNGRQRYPRGVPEDAGEARPFESRT